MRKAQGLCVELPGVQLGAVDGEFLQELSVASADDCTEHCRKLVDCGQAVSDGEGGCRLYAKATSAVVDLRRAYRSAYCGMFADVRDMNSRRKKVRRSVKARKFHGTCVILHGLQLMVGEADSIPSPMGRRANSASACFEACQKLPSCKQATFVKSKSSSACSLSNAATEKIVEVGDDFESVYCGEKQQAHHLKELREGVRGVLQMRRAQGICLDLEGVRLAGGHEVASRTASECAESCRRAPNCAQASFSEEAGSCYHSNHASRQVALMGKEYQSSFCGPLESTMDMKDMQQEVKDATKARAGQGACVEAEGVALEGGGGDRLAVLHGVASAEACFERCRAVPGCGQVSFTRGLGRCHLAGEAVAVVAHVGDAYTSAYCGTPEEEKHLKGLREQVQTDVQMRRAMGICEDLPGVQLADAKGGGRLAAFAPGVNASATGCVEMCRREPQCAQAIFSRGNNGCYLFKEASGSAIHAGKIYHSAFCGQVKEAKHIERSKSKVLQQVQMRTATGICTDMPGIQIADGSGYHEARFSSETGTPDKCVEACRKQLGCEQAVFSAGSKGCYMFETASDVTALRTGGIFHSAYCGDLEQADILEARRKSIKKQVSEREDHGLCFEVPGVRAKDGTSGELASFSGNATREKCVERCRTMVGCEQAVFSVKSSECETFEKATVDIFPGMWEDQAYHSVFCGTRADWEKHKAQQVKVQKLADARKKSGACIDLPGVQLIRPAGSNFYTWAANASECVEHCRTKAYCGQILYADKSCQLFENQTVKFSALGKAYYSARCSEWRDFAQLKAMQNETLTLMEA